MDNWRARLGWVVPSWNTVTEYEVARLTALEASNHFTRSRHTEDTEAAFSAMVDEAPAAVELLAHARLDATVFACTAASFYRGREADLRLGEQLSSAARMPVITMADAIVRATAHLGAERIVVGAPYETWLGRLLVTYLTEAGFDVLGSAFLGDQAYVEHAPDKALELARRGWHDGAEAIVISCGNFRTLESIDRIEGEFGVPAVTSIQAGVWAVSREAGLPFRSDAPGALLRRTPSSAPMGASQRSS